MNVTIEDHGPGEPDGRQASITAGERGTIGLWWHDVPQVAGVVTGCLGGFMAEDPGTAAALLAAGCDHLRQQGCSLALGPMDGNTWRTHRLVTEGWSESPFLLEPSNPKEWCDWWQASGFEVLSRYSSSRFELAQSGTGLEKVRARLEKAGVGIRKLSLPNVERELRSIHQVGVKSFAKNFLYTPISEDEFVAMYAKVTSLLREEYVWLAEDAGKVCGFVFGIPNVLDEGARPDFIVKTLAVLPERRMAGLGSVLVEAVQEAACDAGFSHAIHALQHETNTSLKITRRNGGEVIRRYALYAKPLLP